MQAGVAAGEGQCAKSRSAPRVAQAQDEAGAKEARLGLRKDSTRASRPKPARLSGDLEAWVWKSLRQESRGHSRGQIVEQEAVAPARRQREGGRDEEVAMAEEAKVAVPSRFVLRLEQ